MVDSQDHTLQQKITNASSLYGLFIVCSNQEELSNAVRSQVSNALAGGGLGPLEGG